MSELVSKTNESLLKLRLAEFFVELEVEIQKALNEYWSEYNLLNGQVDLIVAPIHEKQKEYYELLLEYKQQEYDRGQRTGKRLVQRAIDRVKGRLGNFSMKAVKFTHSPDNLFGTKKFTQNRLEKDTFIASESTMSKLDSNVREILGTGYKSGKGIDYVSRQITRKFTQLRTWESSRIARTEIHTAQNLGILKTYEDMNVGYTQWMSAHDMRVRGLKKTDRADHIKLDGEIIPVGGKYSNGLAYPGDKSGRIEEWINCRCANAPFIIPPGYIAPSFTPFREEDLVKVADSSSQYNNALLDATGYNVAWSDFKKGINNVDIVFQPGKQPKSQPKGEYIDVDTLHWGENTQSYMIYKSDLKLNPNTGKYEYKGMVVDYDIKHSFAYVKPEVIAEHNAQFGVKATDKEFIDVSDLAEWYVDSADWYVVNSLDGVKYNPNTGKWEYKGLEVKDYNEFMDIGHITTDEINEHNQKLETKEPEEYIPVTQPDLINTSSMVYKPEYDTYIITKFNPKVKYNENTGKWEYKGLPAYEEQGSFLHFKKEDIIAHNDKVEGDIKAIKEPNPEKISLDDPNIKYNSHDDVYGIKKDKLYYDADTDSYFYKGLEITEWSPTGNYGITTYENILVHNKALEMPTPSNPKHIDIDDLTYNPTFDEYEIPANTDGLGYNPTTGEWEYKGVELKSYELDANGLFEVGYISKADIDAHNNQLETPKAKPKGEPIDIDKLMEYGGVLTNDTMDYYNIQDEKLLKKNPDTGKWELNGLEVEYHYNYDLDFFVYAKVTKADVIKHNEQFGIEHNPIKAEYIDPSETNLLSTDKFIEHDGKWYYKGLEVPNFDPNFSMHHIPKDLVDAHNKQFESEKKPIDTTQLDELSSDSYFIHGNEPELKWNQIKKQWEYNGLKVEGTSSVNNHGYIKKIDVEKHNAQFVKEGKYLDPDKLFLEDTGEHTGEWFVDSEYGEIKLNPDTGKYELVDYGIELTYYDPNYDMGYISQTKLTEHNNTFVKPEPIEVDELFYDVESDSYLLPKSAVKYNATKEQWEWKGLEVDYDGSDIPKIKKDLVDDYNKEKFGIEPDAPNVISESEAPAIEKKPIDTESQFVIEDGDNYNIPDSQLIHQDGKYYYNGLEMDTHIDHLGYGKVSKEKVEQHNQQSFEPKGEAINVLSNDVSYSPSTDSYLIDRKAISKNSETGKYEYKGLEIEDWNVELGKGIISKSSVDQHNEQWGVKPYKHHISAEEGKFIPKDELTYDSSSEEYLLENGYDTDVIYDELTETFFYKGMEIDAFNEFYDSNGIQLETGYISKEQLEEHNAKFEPKEPELEFIDADDLYEVSVGFSHEGEYYIDESDGAIYKGSGEWEFKGATFQGSVDGFHMTKEQVQTHNAKATENKVIEKEIIDTMNLYETSPDVYEIDWSYGIEQLGDKYYYKGLEIKNYNPEEDIGSLTKKQIENHNSLLKGEYQGEYISTADDGFYYSDGYYEIDMDSSDYEVTFNMKTNEWELNGMPVHYTDQDMAYASELLVKVHNANVTNVNKGKTGKIDVDELDYDAGNDWYVVKEGEGLEWNFDTNDWEYEGLVIENTTTLNNSLEEGYLPKELVDAYNSQFEVTGKKQSDKEYISTEAMDKSYTHDMYKVYMDNVDVEFNTKTGKWEYKGLPADKIEDDILFFDESSINDHNKNLAKKGDTGALETQILTVREEGGQKIVTDEKGIDYIIDDGTLEREQDRIQDSNANYSRKERASVAHWGHYGHQWIGNLVYGERGWEIYQDFMNNRALPLLNKMKKQARIMYDDNANNSAKQIAKQKYDQMKEIYTELADNIGDFEVTKVLYEIMDIDMAIEKAPELIENVCLVRYGHFDEEMASKIGEEQTLKGTLSTSYDDTTKAPEGTEHFASKCHRWKMTILAPKGTKGIRLNNYFNAYTTELEWLLQREQKFEVLEYRMDTPDPTCGTRPNVTIRLLN